MKTLSRGLIILLLVSIIFSGPPSLRAEGEDNKLKVLTFNIWGIFNAKHRVVRIKAIAEKIAEIDPDILAIEEAFAYRHRRLLKKSLVKAGYPFEHWKYFQRAYGSGILLISKFPIEKVVWKPYVVNGAWSDIEWLGGKGIAYFRLKTPWGPLDLFHTHAIARMTRIFDEDGNYIEHDYNEVDRHIHMYQIDRFVRERRNAEGRSMIATGDFNVCPAMPEYKLLMALTGFENSFDMLNPGENPSTYSRENMYVKYDSSRIDHIFYKNYEGDRGFWVNPVLSRIEMDGTFINPKTSERTNYSDHYGVYTEFEIISEPGDASYSKAGLGDLDPAERSHDKLDGYSDGVITLTRENLSMWQYFALGVYGDAYEKKDRKNALLLPLAKALYSSGMEETIELRVPSEYVELVEKRIKKAGE